MKNHVWMIGVSLVAALLAGCSGSYNSNSNSSTPAAPTSGLKKRVLLTNSVVSPCVVNCPSTTSGLTIVDAQKDTLAKAESGNPFNKIVTSGGISVANGAGTNQIGIFNNTTEVVTTPTLISQSFDIALSKDGATAYAALRDSGFVEVVGTKNGNVAANIVVPSPARLVEGPNGHILLAFADDPQNLVGNTGGPTNPNANAFFVINTSNNSAIAVALPAGSQPFTAVFDPSDANDTTAFILNCGSECGGTASPSVVKLTFSQLFATPSVAPTVVGTTNVCGATAGLLNGSNLYVAGTPVNPPPASPCALAGTLQVVNASAVTAGNPVAITNGRHGVMSFTSNGRLYIGASNCTTSADPAVPNVVHGCLTIFNTSSSAVTFPEESSFRSNFNVTSLQPISNSNIMYVVQGGELDFFDITLDAPSPSINQVDVIGNAFGVVQIDP